MHRMNEAKAKWKIIKRIINALDEAKQPEWLRWIPTEAAQTEALRVAEAIPVGMRSKCTVSPTPDKGMEFRWRSGDRVVLVDISKEGVVHVHGFFESGYEGNPGVDLVAPMLRGFVEEPTPPPSRTDEPPQ